MIIGLDAASPDASVALLEPSGELIRSSAGAAGGQGEDLLEILLDLLADADRRLTAVSAIGVGLGPGSFTGLRAALSLAKGRAIGLERPIVGVPSLWAWLEGEPSARAALSRAGAAQVHLLLRGWPEPRLVAIDGLPNGLANHQVVAALDLAAEHHLTSAIGPTRAAETIGRIAARRLAAGDADDVARLEPLYSQLPRGIERLDEREIRWL